MRGRATPAGPRRRTGPGPASTLRIIGGQWRGRRLPVARLDGLRPTGDRIRETLFNWLAARIEGADCIDLFAGSGALGLEALSRGARRVVFVEHNAEAAGAIRDALRVLGAEPRAEVRQTDALAWHPNAGRAPDIVFIDPPFAAQLHAAILSRLRPYLGAHTQLYVEYPRAERERVQACLANGFEILRDKQTGAVGYCLARIRPDSEDTAP
ncbi:16S rRNA (guanine(966)-N(2))-methyltransferase RsmD [Salinisphaera sp. T31B1]|uniref:16S rRNA (guanine(966)-N(2))-methyltransferase RsmD n=1 Tax=Salinisphaera sp. T31B1 TaxID=727963 RepID=UPI0033406456